MILMLAALILICSPEAAADLRDCTSNNATTVMRMPAEFGNPATCFDAPAGAGLPAQWRRGRPTAPQLLLAEQQWHLLPACHFPREPRPKL
jgi:hypothetical protein